MRRPATLLTAGNRIARRRRRDCVGRLPGLVAPFDGRQTMLLPPSSPSVSSRRHTTTSPSAAPPVAARAASTTRVNAADTRSVGATDTEATVTCLSKRCWLTCTSRCTMATPPPRPTPPGQPRSSAASRSHFEEIKFGEKEATYTFSANLIRCCSARLAGAGLSVSVHGRVMACSSRF